MEAMTLETKKALSSKYYSYFDSFMKVGLSRLSRRNIPMLVFNDERGCYTDQENKVIVIGLLSPLFSYCGDDESGEKMFILRTLYVLGHEMQHCLSTTKKAWQWGLSGGLDVVCTELSNQLEGPGKRRFKKESDYDNFLLDMQKQNIYISKDMILKIIHGIQNSVCDGRIERLRAGKRFSFKNQMIVVRGANWKEETVEATTKAIPYSELKPGQKLSVKMNQILTLATASLFQKGFLQLYGDTPLVDEVNTYLPFISKGVNSGTCKGAMAASIEIERLLAKDIADVCKLDANSLPEILKKLIEALCQEGTYTGMSSGEESDDGGDGSGNGLSSAKSNKKGSKSANGSGSGDGEDNLEDGDGNNSDDGDGSGNGQPGSGGKENSGLLKNNSKGGRNVGDSSDDISAEDFEASSAEIEKAMEEAAKQAGAETTVITNAVKPSKKGKLVKDVAKPVVVAAGTAEKYDMKDVNFKEVKRKYDVNTPLPTDLQSRADAFEREVDKLFTNQRKPIVRGHQSGHVDASNIYKLVMKQTDYYIKKGQTPEFNGCAYFLQDNSGSMGCGRESKRDFCCQAMAVIEKGFQKHMPLKITAFDASGANGVTHEVIKNFDEQQICSTPYNFFLKGRSGGGNKDGFSIRVATSELLSRAEKEKILIVASDGTPSCYHAYGSGMADVRDAVKDARTAGIKVVGIFFDDDIENQYTKKIADDFASMYEFDYICTGVENIEKELVRILKTFVFS